MILSVTGGFSISAATATRGIATNNSYQMSDDLTIVRGRHQFGVGANLAYWRSLQKTWARGGGTWDFNGQTTGPGLGDFLLGRVALFEQGDAGGVDLSQWYTGAYAQDTWRATDRVTVNAGVRWEPFYGQQICYGAIANFNHDNFLNGVKSTVYRNAPAGFLYPGDQGFPPGQSGFTRSGERRGFSTGTLLQHGSREVVDQAHDVGRLERLGDVRPVACRKRRVAIGC